MGDRSDRHRISLPLDVSFSNAMAEAVQTIGSDGFYKAMLDLLSDVCLWDEGGIMIFYRNQRPQRFIQQYDPAARSLPKDYYLTGPYALDPLYHVFLKGAPTGVYRVRDVAPDDFFSCEFYQLFYSQIGLMDYIDIMWRIDDDSAFVYYMERTVHNPMFQPPDIAALQIMIPFISAVSEKHYQVICKQSNLNRNDIVHQKVQTTVNNFASSILTRREQQVILYMLRGYSAITTAEQLKTTEATVKMHRKNIYRKLDITSQGALFSLFINCIVYAEPGSSIDPLTVYQRKPANPPSSTLLSLPSTKLLTVPHHGSGEPS